MCVMIISGYLKDLERDHLTVVPTLPNFGRLGDVLWVIALLHDTIKLIRCRDSRIVIAQPLEFNFPLPL